VLALCPGIGGHERVVHGQHLLLRLSEAQVGMRGMNAVAAPPNVAAGIATEADNAAFAALLGSVCVRLESAGLIAAGRARESAALAIIEEVARFVLQWEEGSPALHLVP
jgi:hypothetical protein